MRSLIAGLTGLALVLVASGAPAQTAPAPGTGAPVPTPAKPSVDKTTIGDLLANPAAKAVVDKDLPGLTADPRLQQAMGMTLKDIEPYSDGKIDDTVLAKVQADLDSIPAT